MEFGELPGYFLAVKKAVKLTALKKKVGWPSRHYHKKSYA